MAPALEGWVKEKLLGLLRTLTAGAHLRLELFCILQTDFLTTTKEMGFKPLTVGITGASLSFVEAYGHFLPLYIYKTFTAGSARQSQEEPVSCLGLWLALEVGQKENGLRLTVTRLAEEQGGTFSSTTFQVRKQKGFKNKSLVELNSN